jgi:DNA-binding MarR family transcriptional regulator
MKILDSAGDETAEQRIVAGFNRICLALRSMQWAQGRVSGLTPTQAQILVQLNRRGSSRLSAIAEELGVRQPTATEAVNALVRKQLVAKEGEPADGRVVRIALTARGQREARRSAEAPEALLRAVGSLDSLEQECLLRGLSKTIRALQIAGEITPAPLCLTCRYFRPLVHDGPAPHHCAFVDAAFGDRELRVDCPDQLPAPSAQADDAWARFAARGQHSPDPVE